MMSEKADKMAAILTGKENGALKQTIYNMLECEEPVQLCRPIPVRSLPVHYEGQIKFDTDDEYAEVRTRPDPFNFVEITTQIGAATSISSAPNEDIASLCTNDREGAAATKRQIDYQLPILLADGDFLRPVFTEYDATPIGVQIIFAGGTAQSIASGFHGFGIASGAVLTYSVVNNGPVNAQVSVELFKINTVSKASSVIGSGTSLNCAANGAANPTLTVGTLTAFSPDEICVFSLGIVSGGGAGTTVRFKDIEFAPTTLTGFSVSGAYSTEVYTLGQAVYGKGDARATTLDDFFKNCLLWAPVGQSSRLNVRQQVNDAGGYFLASSLPSFVTKELSPVPSKAWQDIVAYGRSYPVKEPIPFRDGSHGTWVPARMQDWEFRAPFTTTEYKLREEASMPSVVLIGQKASATASVKYMFDFNVNFEIQSLNPLVTMKLGPSSPVFMMQFLALASANSDLVGENPKHIERLRKLALKIASNPHVRSAFKWAITDGLPLALSAIA